MRSDHFPNSTCSTIQERVLCKNLLRRFNYIIFREQKQPRTERYDNLHSLSVVRVCISWISKLDSLENVENFMPNFFHRFSFLPRRVIPISAIVCHCTAILWSTLCTYDLRFNPFTIFFPKYMRHLWSRGVVNIYYSLPSLSKDFQEIFAV